MDITCAVAIDKNKASIQCALEEGYIKKGYAVLNKSVYDSDVIFICTPVCTTIEYLALLSSNIKKSCIVTDTASTKKQIIDYINSMDNPPCFIGGHPMAGTEKTGFTSSYSHLFENAYYILSPTKNSPQEAFGLLRNIVTGLGAMPVELDANKHDNITATISHVPHIVASALVNLVKYSDSPDGIMQTLAAGGFKDITRIASSNPSLWKDIVLSNRQSIGGALNKFIETLKGFAEYIDNGNSDSIQNFFESAKNFRNNFQDGRVGLIDPQNELIVDVVDKPGIIGEIATLLGQNGINIKNINVSNSREFESGCLRITLSDPESVKLAYILLSKEITGRIGSD